MSAGWRVPSQHAPTEGWSQLEGGESTITPLTSNMELPDAHEILIVCCGVGGSVINMERTARDRRRDAEVSISDLLLALARDVSTDSGVTEQILLPRPREITDADDPE